MKKTKLKKMMEDPSGLGRKILNELYSNTSEVATNFWEENIDKVSKQANSDGGSSTSKMLLWALDRSCSFHSTASEKDRFRNFRFLMDLV